MRAYFLNHGFKSETPGGAPICHPKKKKESRSKRFSRDSQFERTSAVSPARPSGVNRLNFDRIAAPIPFPRSFESFPEYCIDGVTVETDPRARASKALPEFHRRRRNALRMDSARGTKSHAPTDHVAAFIYFSLSPP